MRTTISTLLRVAAHYVKELNVTPENKKLETSLEQEGERIGYKTLSEAS